MSDKEQDYSVQQASEALKSINQSQQQLLKRKPPMLLTLLISVSYAIIILGYGMTEHENIWALAIWGGFAAYLIFCFAYWYSYRLLGMKLSLWPKSKHSEKMQILTGLTLAALLIIGRQLRLSFDWSYSPHVCAALSGLLLFYLLVKYPTGEYVDQGNSNV